jgi:hypothetical protein
MIMLESVRDAMLLERVVMKRRRERNVKCTWFWIVILNYAHSEIMGNTMMKVANSEGTAEGLEQESACIRMNDFHVLIPNILILKNWNAQRFAAG